jgi:carboxypeptidase Taq
MPVQGSKSRAIAQAYITLMKQERLANLGGLIDRVEKEGDLTDYEKGILRVIRLDLDYFKKVPPKLLEELNRTSTEATMVWREARKKSDYSMFQSYLERMFDLKRQEADCLGYVGHPYNALLNWNEEELTVSDVDRMFASLLPGLKRVLSKIVDDEDYRSSHPLESFEYEQEAMTRVNKEVMRVLNMPERSSRIDVSTHPFVTDMSLEDVRVTTRYEGRSFKGSLFSTIHECGHALHMLQVDPALEYTPLSTRVGLGLSGMYESQSRFWENFVGRSREFTKLIYPILERNLPFVSKYSTEEVYRYFNIVRPSLIRVEADEVTYNFHIFLRYELEKALIGEEASVSEIPSLWNDKMEELLGVRPKNDAEGVLQDTHWSSGIIGDFVNYTTGNVIGGMIYMKIREDLDWAETIQRGELAAIRAWLRERIHKWGATYSPKKLLSRVFGETYNPKYLIQYLEQKYH